MRRKCFIKTYIPSSRKIYELIRENQVASLDFFSQTSYGCCHYDMGASCIFQRHNICSIIHLCRWYGMFSSMSRKNHYINSFNHSHFQWWAWLSIFRRDLDIFRIFQNIRIVQSWSSNDSDFYLLLFGHIFYSH